MIGINYRYELNETKQTIKLAPTKGVLITSLVLTILPWAALLVLGTVLDDSDRKKKPDLEEHTMHYN